MFRLRQDRFRPRRRGVILLVVLTLLTLFALVGISFVLVASSQETSARIAREGETAFKPQIDPEAAFASVMRQLLYDLPDYEPDTQPNPPPNTPPGTEASWSHVHSALRGHSLVRNLYGWNKDAVNDRPFSGVGRLSNRYGANSGDFTNRDDIYLVNYQAFPASGGQPLLIRDPERLQLRNSARAAVGTYIPMASVPYTYPDHNNFFLGQIDPKDRRIITQSFHRSYLFGRLDDANNPNWTGPIGKYLTLRPTRAHHNVTNKEFPYPVDGGGDVKNLDGAPGGCDSIWIDIGAPVMTSADGRYRYKMLVAPLILELDSRLNLNVVGNLLGGSSSTGNPPQDTRDHRSHQGWGPWEMNPKWVLNDPLTDSTQYPDVSTVKEWRGIFDGQQAAANGLRRYRGRYDRDAQPPKVDGPAIVGDQTPRAWAQVDYDGIDNVAANKPFAKGMLLPEVRGSMTLLQRQPLNLTELYHAFPDYFADTYKNGGSENDDHPSIFNPFWPVTANTGARPTNRLLPFASLARVLRHNGTGTDMLNAELYRLLLDNLRDHPQDPARDALAKLRRNLITLHSADLDRPGATPYIWDPTGKADPNEPAAAASLYKLNQPTANKAYYSLSNNASIPFPQIANLIDSTKLKGDFDVSTWRKVSAAVNRLNLNRTLNRYSTTDQAQNDRAIADRKAYASDIFALLLRATGAMDVPTLNKQNPAPTPESFRATRTLAQLAVNIVDYLDEDEVMTVFDYTQVTAYNEPPPIPAPPSQKDHFVVGTELPRLLLNETYVQYDVGQGALNGNRVEPDRNYHVNVWVELMNPLPDTLIGTTNNNDAILQDGTKAIYRLVFARPNLMSDDDPVMPNPLQPLVLRHPANSLGDPDFDAQGAMVDRKFKRGVNRDVDAIVTNWGPAGRVVKVKPFVGSDPINGRFQVTMPPQPPVPPAAGDIEVNGMYILGPDPTLTFNNAATEDPTIPLHYYSPDMWYTLRAGDQDMNDTALNNARPTIVLQRLANPNLAVQLDWRLPNYNPYVTVDVVDVRDKTAPNATDAHYVDSRTHDTNGTRTPPDMVDRQSWGRSQPYNGNGLQRIPQPAFGPPPPKGPAPVRPKHTFSRQNSTAIDKTTLDNAQTDATLAIPFAWPVHLDRAPVSPAELLHVGISPPHLMLDAFKADVNKPGNQHAAPWLDPTARIGRFLEFVTCGLRGSSSNSRPHPIVRIPGRVNINTVWNAEMWRAICDPRQASTTSPDSDHFNVDHVNDVFTRFLDSRSPLSTSTPAPYSTDQRVTDNQNPPITPTADNRPFWSLALGYTKTPNDAFWQLGTNDRGVDNLLLRDYPSQAGKKLLDYDPTTTLPKGTYDPTKFNQVSLYRRKELLTKIMNNVTTRSNVFAVWLTVGFFEVVSDPNASANDLPKLGREVGRDENRHVRYRMFALVDRTQAQVWPTMHTSNTQHLTVRTRGAVALTNNAPTELAVKLDMVDDAATGTYKRLTEDTGAPSSGVGVGHPDSAISYRLALSEGLALVYEPNTANEETVILRSVPADPPTNPPSTVLKATFTRAHPDKCAVVMRGNPGPLKRYDPRKDTDVVPYFQLID